MLLLKCFTLIKGKERNNYVRLFQCHLYLLFVIFKVLVLTEFGVISTNKLSRGPNV